MDNIKAIRIYYNKLTGDIINTCSLSGEGVFPYPIEKGTNQECITITKQIDIENFRLSDDNKIVNGVLVIGSPRPVIIPEKPRDALKEIDDLKTKLEKDYDITL